MHLQTLAITINQSLIGKVRLLLTMLHHTVRTQTRFFTRKGSGTFFVYRRFCGESTQNGKQERIKAGYHHEGSVLPFALHPLYCTFRVNRCVRPYMAGTHVRRKKGRFLHIGVFFRLSVWYTRFSLTNRNLQDGETYGRIDTKMFMGNYRLI